MRIGKIIVPEQSRFREMTDTEKLYETELAFNELVRAKVKDEEKLQAQAALIEKLGEQLLKHGFDKKTVCSFWRNDDSEALAAYGEWRKENGGKV